MDESMGFLINYTGRKITQLVNQYLSSHDITAEQWVVLNRLAEQDGITQKELAQRVGKDPTNITRILDQLEKKGLIARRHNALDRRSYLASLTEEGRALDLLVSPLETHVMNLALEGLSEEQVTELKRSLLLVAQNINKHL